jgi:uncharacterized damage-inducible protein DinB
MAVGRPLNAEREIAEEFERCGRMTEYLVTRLPRRFWHQQPPGGHGRTIAAMVTHIHGVRSTLAKMGGAPALPPLDRKAVTPVEARRALRQINDVLIAMFTQSLARGEARVKGLPRRTINMMVYLTQHDAHHRGQITMRARELGHAFSSDDVMRLWGWKKLSKRG